MTDASLDHRTLEWAVEIIGMCEPIRCIQGGMWFGRNHNMADATFVDYGAADAFAVAAKALPGLVKALKRLEEANDKLAGLRTQEMYLAMLDAGQEFVLADLQDARNEAKRILGDVSTPGKSND